MVLRKIETVSFALQISALAVFAVILSNVLTIVFFTGDRASVIRTIVSVEAVETLTPLVRSVVEDGASRVSNGVSIGPVGLWAPKPDAWQKSSVVASQLVQQDGKIQVDAYLPLIGGSFPIDVFRQVQKGGPQVAAIVRIPQREPVLIISRIRPNLPPPIAALISTFVSSLFIVVGVMMLIGRMTQPLRSLSRASQRIGQTSEIETVPERGPPELQSAARAFNVMSTRIGQLLDRQRSTLWALGHDLRTPVTAMRIRLELVDDEETREKLKMSVKEIERVVEDALFLARSGLGSGPSKTCALDTLIHAAVHGLVEADPKTSSRIIVLADPFSVAQVREGDIVRAIRNLAHNGLRHTNGPVYIKTLPVPQLGIQVEDWGPGLPDPILASPGQPFVRGDNARGSDGSTGLGLAIVRSIIESHGGQLLAEARRNGPGTIFTLVFNEIV
jgi:signal transduction histidine kinase